MPLLLSLHAGTMVSKDSGRCILTTPEQEVEPAACLALEMRYALDPNRQIKKRNKALQVRFKDICEAQNEQRDTQLSSGPLGEKREAKAVSCRVAYRKYMTVPARRSIPNVTKSTGVQTSPDLRKCYQTFPLDRKKGSLKGLPAADAFKSQNNGFLADSKEKSEAGPMEDPRPCSAGRIHKTTALVFHSNEHVNALEQPSGVNCEELCKTPDVLGYPEALLQNSRAPSEEPGQWLQGRPKIDRGTLDSEEPTPLTHGRVFKTEVATVYTPAVSTRAPEPGLSNSAATSQWSLCPADEEQRRAAHLNGLQASTGSAVACSTPVQCLSPECSEQQPLRNQPSPTAGVGDEERQQIVPHTEVVDLKAQLQVMENLISSSQETIKVLLGVIQELEKGEAHREGYVCLLCLPSCGLTNCRPLAARMSRP